jgi:hypothetical protein
MTARLDLILCAVNDLHAAATTLVEYARDLATDPQATLTTFEDTPQCIATALATALESLGDDKMTEDDTQLLGALRRYLEGWIP